MHLLRISDLAAADVRAIWSLAAAPIEPFSGTVAWSFEGNGIRTRTTFLQAFRELGLASTELPNLLKSIERPRDIAGYLDPFYDVYVIRESSQQRLAEFAAASCRPVINAMSSEGHPCEVLADAYFIHTAVRPIESARVCLWGPPTNVLRSWQELAAVLGMTMHHVCDARFHERRSNVDFTDTIDFQADVLITDGWPSGQEGAGLTEADLAGMGHPRLLPTPPFSIGRELSFDPRNHPGFAGYDQKKVLVPVQKAILRHATEPR
jgi:ornithine carbamoyltransferase